MSISLFSRFVAWGFYPGKAHVTLETYVSSNHGRPGSLGSSIPDGDSAGRGSRRSAVIYQSRDEPAGIPAARPRGSARFRQSAARARKVSVDLHVEPRRVLHGA